MARVPLRRQADLPREYQYLLDEDAMGEIYLLCTMANNPDVLQAYMRYGTTLWTKSGLDKADLERCILTVACALDAAYEWNQHIPIARECGVDDEEIHAIAAELFDQFDDRHAALLRYVRAVALGDVDDNTYEAVARHVDDSTVIGATQVATHYLATARFLDALAVSLEESFVGWDPTDEY